VQHATAGDHRLVARMPRGVILAPMLWKIVLVLLVIAAATMFYLRFAAVRISGSEARQLVANGAILLDVRSPMEFAGGHIDGARSIPIQDLPRRIDELGNKTGAIVVYCQSGGRSAVAKRLLERDGFTNVHDLGGIGQW
jgi:rhodanese-related sulfurtransferase